MKNICNKVFLIAVNSGRDFIWIEIHQLYLLLLSSLTVITAKALFFRFFVVLLTHFMPLISFDTPRKYQKTSGFLMFSWGIERDQWHEMG